MTFKTSGAPASFTIRLLSAASLIALATPALAQQTETPGPAAGGVAQQSAPGSTTAADSAQADSTAQADGTPADSTTGDIVVLGVRGAQRAAIDTKRQSSEIVDSIVAEDIGKLPDTTIADSLQRVPGVQIGRSAGEGSSVNVRGLGQVLVTINGERFLGGSSIDGAQPNFTDIPPTLFSGVDVYKSSSAKQLEGGVSGTIDLKTRRPLDLKRGLTTTASFENSIGDRVNKVNGDASGLLGYRGERFGFLIAGSYSKADLANTSINTGNSWLISTDELSGRDLQGDGDIGRSAAGVAASANPADPTHFGNHDFAYQPAVSAVTNLETERERIGLNASGQLKLGQAFTLTADGSYTKLNNQDRAVAVQLNSGYGPLALQNGSQVDSNGVVGVGIYRFPGYTINSSNTPSSSRAINTNLQLDYDNGGHFKGSVRWIHGDAKRDSQTSQADSKPVYAALVTRGDTARCRVNPAPADCTIRANPNGLPDVTAGLDYTQKNPGLIFGTDITNPANYALLSTWGYGDHRASKYDAYRADGSYSFDDSFLKSVDVGLRYGKKDVTVDNYKYLAPVTVPGLGLLDGPGDLYYFKDPQIGHTGRPEIAGRSVIPLLPFSSLPAGYASNFTDFLVKGVPAAGIPAIDPRAMDNPLAFQNSLFPGNVAYNDPSTSFRVSEKTETAYGQANFGGDLVLPVSGNIGLRVVRTERTVFSNTTDPNQFIGTGGSYNGTAINLGTTATTKKYTRFLPSANLAIETASKMKLRFAFAKVVGELNLFDLGAGQVLYYGVNNGRYPDQPSDLQIFLQGNSGNPNLEPYQSTNYNVSYEWYFGQGGLLSAAAFLFDVKSFPQGINQILPIADQDGVVRAGGNVSSTGNGTGGKIKGIEIGYQQQFNFLPGFLSGFGANANYTYSDSSSSNVDLFGKTLPVPDNSKHQYNVVGFYQKGPLQARVAYNWRSKRYAGLQSVNGFTYDAGEPNHALAIFSRPVGYLDASISYDVTPQFTVYAQGSNLTNAYDDQYAQFSNQFYSQSVYERRFAIGVRIRN